MAKKPPPKPVAKPAAPVKPQSYTIKMAQADTRARATPVPKPRPPAKPPAPAWKSLQGQMKNVFGGDPYAGEQAAIQYGWSQGLPPMETPSYDVDTGGFEGYGGGGGFGFDFGMLEAQQNEDLAGMRSGIGSRIKQALIDLGLTDTSQLSAEAQGYVDQPTIEAAKANKYSLFAKVAEASAKQTAQSRARLAAMGMLDSGQLSREATETTRQAEEKRYAGTREFTGSVGELLSQYAQRQREWAQRIAEARMQAAAMGYGGGGGGGGGPVDPATGRGYDSPERGGRPGEWADLPVRVGWNPAKNSDAEYDMSGATRTPWGFIGPQGQRYDENGRVI